MPCAARDGPRRVCGRLRCGARPAAIDLRRWIGAGCAWRHPCMVGCHFVPGRKRTYTHTTRLGVARQVRGCPAAAVVSSDRRFRVAPRTRALSRSGVAADGRRPARPIGTFTAACARERNPVPAGRDLCYLSFLIVHMHDGEASLVLCCVSRSSRSRSRALIWVGLSFAPELCMPRRRSHKCGRTSSNYPRAQQTTGTPVQ
jgi:hypothetical protein